MNWEEITKEIDLRTDAHGKIIHVNFQADSSRSPKEQPRMEWLRRLDVREPWILRLVAVLSILALSMLIL